MKFSEFLSFKPNDPENVKRLSNMGVLSFKTGISNKTESVTPHYEIDECLTNFETIPIINSAINQLVSFIIPNKEIKISSNDPKSVEFLEKWHRQRECLEEMKNILTTNIACGNGFKENFYAKTVDDKKVFDNFFSLNDASRIYVNPDDIDGPTAFIFELPIGVKQFKYMGVMQQPTFYTVKYIKNYTFTFKRVYGIPIPAWKYDHYKSGWSRDNLYGRSMLASAIDACNIFQEIMSSWDTIAKTRQIDQKLISLADNETGMTFDEKQIEAMEEKLNNADNSYNIIGLPLKVLQTDISVSQGFNLMETAVDILRRQIMMALLPQHLTPWNDSATTQGSEASMPPFMLRLKSKQNEFINFLNRTILDQLKKTYTWLADDISYVFDEPKVMPDEYYTRQMLDLVRDGIITKKEAKEYMMKIGVLDESIFESITDTKEGETVNDTKEGEAFTTSEAIKNADVGFQIFKQRLNSRYSNKPFSTLGWKQIDSDEVGGHKIRLVDSGKTVYMIFDGLNLIDTFDKDVVSDKKAKQHMQDYVQTVKDSFDKFEDEDTEEDKAFDLLQQEIEDEYKKRLDKFFSQIPKSSKKKEGFLSDKIFGKLDDVFKGFNQFIKDRVNNIVKKYNVNVIKDDEEGDLPKKDVDMLKDKNKLMVDSLSKDLQQVKDNQVSTIRIKLSQGIAAGREVKDIQSDIEADMNYEKGVAYKIKRAVQTSGRNSVRILKLRKMLAQGFYEVIWQTREDNKVRIQHKQMNGKVFKIVDVIKWITQNKTPNGSNFFNCRCSFIGY